MFSTILWDSKGVVVYFSLSVDHVLHDGHVLCVRHDGDDFLRGHGCVHFRGHAYDHGHGGHHADVNDHHRIQDHHDCDHGYDLPLFQSTPHFLPLRSE